MKITYIANTDSQIIDNMYPRLFKNDLYYVTMSVKDKGIIFDKFMSRNSLSIHLKDVAIFTDVNSAEEYANQFIKSSDIPSNDIVAITIKHIVKGLCRKCGRSERHGDNSVLCLPCSYT